MPISFVLAERPGGFALDAAQPGDHVRVQFRELIGPGDAVHLSQRLESLQEVLFAKIEGLPRPSSIDHLVVEIRPDLTGTAWVNELQITAEILPARDIEAGEAVYTSDIRDIRPSTWEFE